MYTKKERNCKSKRKEIWTGLRTSFQDHNLPARDTKPILDFAPQLSPRQAVGRRAKMLKGVFINFFIVLPLEARHVPPTGDWGRGAGKGDSGPALCPHTEPNPHCEQTHSPLVEGRHSQREGQMLLLPQRKKNRFGITKMGDTFGGDFIE